MNSAESDGPLSKRAKAEATVAQGLRYFQQSSLPQAAEDSFSDGPGAVSSSSAAASLPPEQKAGMDANKAAALAKMATAASVPRASSDFVLLDAPLEDSWRQALQGEFRKDYFQKLRVFLEAELQAGVVVYPPSRLIFNALNLCTLANVKVVILGQDPYHGTNQAHGSPLFHPPSPFPKQAVEVFRSSTLSTSYHLHRLAHVMFTLSFRPMFSMSTYSGGFSNLLVPNSVNEQILPLLQRHAHPDMPALHVQFCNACLLPGRPGLCFSVQKGVPTPPSLLNIYQELQSDIQGFQAPKHGCLEGWAQRGVLLLNALLTVRARQPLSHASKGWEPFTDAIISYINTHRKGVVFLLWGAPAQKKGLKIDKSKHLVLRAVHPSPLSAHKGWFGSKHFSKANAYLQKNGKEPVDWSLTEDC